MSTLQFNKTRIAKNTLLLYLRMFVIMSIGLYTSRLILQTLGISDYGLYNVVGGIVAMMNFLNTGMATASQRYISYEIGKGNNIEIANVFSASILVHVTIALIGFIIAESIGVWFLNTHMNISSERLIAANWVFQSAIIVFIINVISVPYNAAIIAYEKMEAFAYISFLETLLKLLSVCLLVYVSYDKLIIYAILNIIIAFILRACYMIYCKKHFRYCSFNFNINKKMFYQMFSFAGWSVIGNLGFSFKDQLSNIILNIFYGTTVNAARGVGIQVCGIVSSFSQNFGMAINPQITKQYAIGDYEKSSLLVYNGARISFYLLAIISIPIIINANYILDLWLVDVPKYTSNFLTLSLITSLIYSLSGTSSVAIQATGRMKVFQIGICLILLLELPIGYILLKFSYPPYFIMIPSLFTYILSIFFRFYLLKSYVRIYRWSIFLKNVVGRCLAVFILSMGSCFVLFSNQQHNFTSFVISAILCVLITIIYIVFLGVSSIERRYLFNKIIMRIKNR